jgi:hypothetical protein
MPMENIAPWLSRELDLPAVSAAAAVANRCRNTLAAQYRRNSGAKAQATDYLRLHAKKWRIVPVCGAMHDRIAKSRTAAYGLCFAALAIVLCGCASGPLEVFVLADSGKYQFHNCEQLAASAKSQSLRVRELKELIDKAEQSVGGHVVSVIAYRADYIAVNEDLRVIASTARAKNCQTPDTWQSNSAIR